MDFALKQELATTIQTLIEVSILVLMDFALKHNEITGNTLFWTAVSILVLMDFALKHIHSCIFCVPQPSFNPCFDGFCS